jgi:glycogen debranching enzyme
MTGSAAPQPLTDADAAGAAATFYIPAVDSLVQIPSRTIKQGDTFAIFDEFGDFGSAAAYGLFHEDTRYLSRFALRLEGRRPLLLSSSVQDDNVLLTVDLTNPDIYQGGRLVLVRDSIHLYRTKFLWDGACCERIAIRNYGDRPRRIEIAFDFAADFADLFEVRGHVRARRGEMSPACVGADNVTLGYRGLDGRRRETRLAFEPVPDEIDAGSVVYRLDLAAGSETMLFANIVCVGEPAEPQPRRRFFVSLRDARRFQRGCMVGVPSVETSNNVFNEMLCRSVADLYMLLSATDYGLYPYAGIPWFSTPFGRDGIITAIETLWFDPRIAKGVLQFLAATQATEIDPAADSEPGKILHETRKSELALLGEVPFRRYYGSVDATPLFVLLAGLYFQRTGDQETVAALWPKIEAALGWIAKYGDLDGDGFVEYRRQREGGLVNQGWKDSNDAIFHADGALAEGPIALCEVQGYVYAAKRAAAEIARSLGMAAMAATLDAEASDLRDRFEAAFWREEIGTYALALDGRKRPCAVRTSNAGHALFAGIAAPARAARVAALLTGPTGFSGWGVRTVMSGEARYNPMSYHNGSVWPHDNALIGLGMARYGLKQPAATILDGMFRTATYTDLRRLPELFCGFSRVSRNGPTAYPVACAPQAWASATPLALLQACLGLELRHRDGEIRFHSPTLPESLDTLILRNLRLNEAVVSIAVRRSGREVSVTPLERRGEVRIATLS